MSIPEAQQAEHPNFEAIISTNISYGLESLKVDDEPIVVSALSRVSFDEEDGYVVFRFYEYFNGPFKKFVGKRGFLKSQIYGADSHNFLFEMQEVGGDSDGTSQILIHGLTELY